MDTILALIDYDELAETVADEAAAWAVAFGSRVFLLHVEDPEPDFVGYQVGPQYIRDHEAARIRQDMQHLGKLRERVARQGIEEVESLIIQGDRIDKIRDEISRINPDLLIMGWHPPHGLLHRLFGGVGETLIRHLPCRTLLVPASTGPE